jgi:hypothetical protein
MAASPKSAAPVTPPPEPALPKPSHRTRNVVIVAVAVVVAIITVLACMSTIPISHSYSYTITTASASTDTATLNPPSGAQVHGTFTTTDGRAVAFVILAGGNPGTEVGVFTSNYGSFNFTATDPPYVFWAYPEVPGSSESDTVDISGHYAAPMLVL